MQRMATALAGWRLAQVTRRVARLREPAVQTFAGLVGERVAATWLSSGGESLSATPAAQSAVPRPPPPSTTICVPVM